MPEDYYDNPSPETEAPSNPESSDEKPDSTKTFLINKDVCEGMQPGDELVVRIEQVLEKEYAVSYSPEPEHKEEDHDEGEMASSSGGGDGGMADMMY